MANTNINTEVVETTETTEKGKVRTFFENIIKNPVTHILAGAVLGVVGTKVAEKVFSKKDETPDEYVSNESDEGYVD